MTTPSPIPIRPAEPSCKIAGVPREPIFKGDYSFNTGKIHSLSTLDYIIFIAALGVSTMIGAYVAWNNRRRIGIDDFLLAGRNMSAIPVGLSMISTFLSGITVIGMPLYTYVFSTIFFWQGLSLILALYTIASVFMPVFYQLRLTSAYQYLEKRFSKEVRVLAASFFVIWMVVYLSLILYAPSLAMNAAAGFNMWGSILSVGILCILYTTLGGMKAVIYTDAFQVAVMIVGFLVMLIKANSSVASWADMWESATRTKRINFFDFRLDLTVEHTFWTIMIEGYVYVVIMFGANQVQVHRYICCRSVDTARRAVWIAVMGVMIILYSAFFLGLFVGTFYENCDPKKAGLITSSDQLIPLFVMDTMIDTPGLPGVFMAALFCATLSSVSSALNSIATVILEDFIRPYVKSYIKEDRARLMTQVLTIIFGLICLELTFFASKVEGLLSMAAAANGALASSLLGVFCLGMFFPWANDKGALCSMAGGTVFNIAYFVARRRAKLPPPDLAMTCVSNCNITAFLPSKAAALTRPAEASTPFDGSKTNFFLRISSRLLPPIGVVVTIVTGLIVSYFTGLRDPNRVDPRLIVPVCDVLFPFYYLPENIRKKLRFGIDHTDKWNKWLFKRYTPSESKDFFTARPDGAKEQELIRSVMPKVVSNAGSPMLLLPASKDNFRFGSIETEV